MAFATSQNIDQLLARGLAFRLPNNAPISSLFTLYANGAGQTYWSNSMNPRDLSTLSSAIGELASTVSSNFTYQQAEIYLAYGQISTLSTALVVTSNALVDYINSSITGLSTFSTFYNDLNALSNATGATLSSLSTSIGVGNASTIQFLTSTLTSTFERELLSTSTGLYNYTNRVSSATVFYTTFYSTTNALNSIILSTSTGLNNRIIAGDTSLSTNIVSLRSSINSTNSNFYSTISGYGPRIGRLETASTGISTTTNIWISSQIGISQSTQDAVYNEKFFELSSYLSSIAIFATAQFGELSSISSALQESIVANNSTNATQNAQISTLARNLSILTTSSILANIYDTFNELEQYTVNLIISTLSFTNAFQSSLTYSTFVQTQAYANEFYSTFTNQLYTSSISTVVSLTIDNSSTLIGDLYSTGIAFLESSLTSTLYGRTVYPEELTSTVVFIGSNAGSTFQGEFAIAIGYNAGQSNMGCNAVAIGNGAGVLDMGAYAVAIGSGAGAAGMSPSSIVINATGGPLNSLSSGLYIAPVRSDDSVTLSFLHYNTATGEFVYNDKGGGQTISSFRQPIYVSSINSIAENIIIRAQTSSIYTINKLTAFRDYPFPVSGPFEQPFSIAGNGQYITYTANTTDGFAPSNAYVYVSSDFGSSFTSHMLESTYYLVYMNPTSQYQFLNDFFAFSTSFISLNYGSTWDGIVTPDIPNDAEFNYNGSKLWIATGSGTYETSDYSNWTQINVQPAGTIAASSNGNVIAIGTNTQDLILSKDGGATFNVIYASGVTNGPVISANGSTIVFLGDGNTNIYKSVDQGSNWSVIFGPDSFSYGINISADGQRITAPPYYSLNGGASWSTLTFAPEFLNLTSFNMAYDGSVFYAVGDTSFNGETYVYKSGYIINPFSVGINTDNPTATLDISGSLHALTTRTNQLTTSSIYGVGNMNPALFGTNGIYLDNIQNFSAFANFPIIQVSSDGQFVAAIDGLGAPFLSTDFGILFSVLPYLVFTNDIAISQNGFFILYTGNGGNGYDLTLYNRVTNIITAITSVGANDKLKVAMSASGQYMITMDNTYQIWKSNDFGVTWTAGQIAPLATGPLGLFISDDGTRILTADSIDVYRAIGAGAFTSIFTTGTTIGSITMNADGSIIQVCDDQVHVSRDFGGTFTTYFTSSGFYPGYMNRDTGKYQLVNDYLTSNLYHSYDYGSNWSTIITDISGGVFYGGVSGDGSVVFYTQYNFLAPAYDLYRASNIIGVQNVAVNKSTAQYTLDISGSLAFSDAYVSSLKVQLTDVNGKIAIGNEAGAFNQSSNTIAIGNAAGYANQDSNAIALGRTAGFLGQITLAIAIGDAAGYANQDEGSVAIGVGAGYSNQYKGSVAIGVGAGYNSQSAEAVAIGCNTGYENQQPGSVAIGTNAGYSNQGVIGDTYPGYAIAIGDYAGAFDQGADAIAIGDVAGYSNQSYNAIAIGLAAGYSNQSYNTIAIGLNAGNTNQITNAIAIGINAGASNQSNSAIAIGTYAGCNAQSNSAIAIGEGAGIESQGRRGIAIGYYAGASNQNGGAGGSNSIAIGSEAGLVNQGSNSIAIGTRAGKTNQIANSIVLNASNADLDAPAKGFYVNPVRLDNTDTSGFVHYNSLNKEIFFRTSENNILIETNNNNQGLRFANSLLNTLGCNEYYICRGFTPEQNRMVFCIPDTAGSNTAFHFRTAANSLLFMNGSNGFVGIGNSNPAYKLDVSGDARVTGSTITNALSAANISGLSTVTNALSAANISATSTITNALSATNAQITTINATSTVSQIVRAQVVQASSIVGFSPINFQDAVIFNSSITAGVISVSSINTTNLQVPSLELSTLGVSTNLRVGTNSDNVIINTGAWTSRDSSRNWYNVASSSTGQIQAATVYGGQIYVSTDFGVTWTAYATNQLWQGIAMSYNGQYMLATVNGSRPWRSSDFGVTWTQITSLTNRNWFSAAISETGQYQTLTIFTNNTIFVSSDYGITWTSTAVSATWRQIAISASGQYQLSGNSQAGIYVSTDFGQTWVNVSQLGTPYSTAISASGQYMIVGDTFSGTVYISKDYGSTWSTISSMLGNRLGISMDSTGQYVIAVGSLSAYYSSDYGTTWQIFNDSNVANAQHCTISKNAAYMTIIKYNGGLYTNANYNLNLNVAGSGRLSSFMFVGTAPGQDAAVFIGSGQGAASSRTLLLQNDTAGNCSIRNMSTSGSLQLGAGNTNVVTINSNGNVGVNQGAPAYRFDVNGTARFASNTFVGTTPGADVTLCIGSGLGAAPSRTLLLQNDASGNCYIRNMSTSGFLQLGAGNASWITINSNGNVGINQGAPAYALDVNGTTYTNTLYFPTNTGRKISLWGGATNQYFGFEVQAGELRNTINSSSDIVSWGYQNVGGTFTETMRLGGNGNLGIGTTSAAYKLDVTGSIRATQSTITSTLQAANVVTLQSTITGNLFATSNIQASGIITSSSNANLIQTYYLGGLGNQVTTPGTYSGTNVAWVEVTNTVFTFPLNTYTRFNAVRMLINAPCIKNDSGGSLDNIMIGIQANNVNIDLTRYLYYPNFTNASATGPTNSSSAGTVSSIGSALFPTQLSIYCTNDSATEGNPLPLEFILVNGVDYNANTSSFKLAVARNGDAVFERINGLKYQYIPLF